MFREEHYYKEVNPVVWGIAMNWPGYNDYPIAFVKAVSAPQLSLFGKICLYDRWSSVRPEIELAIRVGSPGEYAVANDVTGHFSDYDPHLPHGKMEKSWCHIGPFVPKNEMPRGIAMAVNRKQIFFEYLSRMTFVPEDAVRLVKNYGAKDGDVVLMGTPFHEQVTLRDGDTVQGWIQGLYEREDVVKRI